MFVTLYTDASWDHKARVGGWACWLRSNQGKIVRAGYVPDYCVYAYEAELAAVFAGIWTALQSWDATHTILIRSDCQQALALVDGQSAAKHYGACRLQSKLQELRRSSNVRLLTRWVKGHRRSSTTDAWVNNRVDQIARDRMQEQRKLKSAPRR